MKNTLMVIMLLIGLYGLSAFEKQTDVIHIEAVECKYRQCNATAKSTGKRCKHCVSNSDDYKCWQHKPK